MTGIDENKGDDLSNQEQEGEEHVEVPTTAKKSCKELVVDPLEKFKGVLNLIATDLKGERTKGNSSEHPLFWKIQQCMKAPSQNLVNLCKTDSDSAFACYLVSVARSEGMAYYVRALKFVLLYREHFHSRFSGAHRVGGKNLKPVPDNLTHKIPDICNEFVLEYCKAFRDRLWMPKRSELITLTESLCSWLYEQGLTDRTLFTVSK